MKIRNGFVSNSSSSSFIVIATDGKFNQYHKSNTTISGSDYELEELELPASLGHNEFGWEMEKFSDFYSKLNFTYIQARDFYSMPYGDKTYLDMLKEVVLESAGLFLKFDPDDHSIGQGYIDHQSSIREGENDEMFENKNTLVNFLFRDDSFIQGDNDN